MIVEYIDHLTNLVEFVGEQKQRSFIYVSNGSHDVAKAHVGHEMHSAEMEHQKTCRWALLTITSLDLECRCGMT